MIIDFYSILPLTGALFILFFGAFIISKNLDSRMYQLLFGFCMTMFFWMFGTSMMFATRHVPEIALFWDRFVYFGVVFMPPFMHHFSLLFTGRRGEQKRLLAINYFIAFLFLFASVTPYFVDGLYYYWWGVHSQARILHTVFLGYFFLGTGLFFVNLWQYFRRLKEKAERVRTIYVFVAFAIVIFIGGSAYLFAYNIDTRFPFAYLTGIIFPVMLFYSVMRHHTLGIRVVLTEVLVGITNAFVILQIFLAKDPLEIAIRVLFAVLIVIISVLLNISTSREVRRREELQVLTHELSDANKKLKKLDEAKSEFISIASHQLRTPLSIIKGYISMIMEGDYGKVEKRLADPMSKIYISNERLINLVDNLLDISRIESGRMQYDITPVQLEDVVAGVTDDLSMRAKDKKLYLKFVRPKEALPKVMADGSKIHEIIMNLVDNAIKYTERGGITVSLHAEDHNVGFCITDTGVGVTKEEAKVIFQKFMRGDGGSLVHAGGAGLGLFIAKKIIDDHGGKIWAESDGRGKGSRFCFSLPVARNI